ncbi:nuclear transport factor 2 family protein [Nonomuraea sediminis]|uniref:nuclear transport factor 2 family protein n=1 Tax=Nonomuraea sediminis TaxID=2835864 RepID=UPI001BDCA8F9|nr:nuclear transport factor 2 family protein [Nonomuraea sediminis]
MDADRLAAFGAAWREKDLDRLMSFMTDDCVFGASVGAEHGTVFRGRDEVRRGFELMLAYDAGARSNPGTTFLAGDRGVSTWSYTYPDAAEVHGCDIYEFDGDRIRVKDAYRKVSGDITRPFPQGA